MKDKVFVIFNTAGISEVIVTNTLVRNIKLYFPDSRIVFVCNPSALDAVKYQSGVSDVIVFDEKSQKSLKNVMEFVKNFPYKKPFASFVISRNKRFLIAARLIGSLHIISDTVLKFFNTDEKFKMREYTHIKDKFGGMVEPLTNEHKNLPAMYMPPEMDNALIQSIKALNKPTVLCASACNPNKNMKTEDCIELINLLNVNGHTPVVVGIGEAARNYVNDLKKSGCIDFIDLIDCTSFVELANIIKICGSCISIDTGTLHLANALQIPVVGIFYDGQSYMWGSDTNLYPAKILDSDLSENKISPQDIIRAYKELMGICV